MRPIPILAAPLAAALATGTVQAKEFRSSGVHPLDYPTVQAVADARMMFGMRAADGAGHAGLQARSTTP